MIEWLVGQNAPWREFNLWRDGVDYAVHGGLWLHRHTWYGHSMAHLVSSDRGRLERVGLSLGLHPARLQYRPIKCPGLDAPQPAWHWDLVGPWVPSRDRRAL